MRHDEAYRRLCELVALPSSQRASEVDAAVLAHAARCATCARRLATLTRIDRSLLRAAHDHFSAEQPTAALTRRVLAIPTTRPTPPRRRAFRTRVVASAATLILAIGVTVPLWLSSRNHTDRVAVRTMHLHARNGLLSGTVTLGVRSGSTQSLRLMAEGLATGTTRNYSIWLTGRDGDILIRSFSANHKGACDIHADAPQGHWSAIAITMSNRAPTKNTIIASAAL